MKDKEKISFADCLVLYLLTNTDKNQSIEEVFNDITHKTGYKTSGDDISTNLNLVNSAQQLDLETIIMDAEIDGVIPDYRKFL